MYRIEVKPGEEAVFRTIEELATGIRNGFVTPRARIYHAASQKWLPIEFHPHYKRALEGTFTPTPPTPQPSLAEMPAPTFAFPSAAPAPASSSTALNPPASPTEPAPRQHGAFTGSRPIAPSGQGAAHRDRGSGVSGARDARGGASTRTRTSARPKPRGWWSATRRWRCWRLPGPRRRWRCRGPRRRPRWCCRTSPTPKYRRWSRSIALPRDAPAVPRGARSCSSARRRHWCSGDSDTSRPAARRAVRPHRSRRPLPRPRSRGPVRSSRRRRPPPRLRGNRPPWQRRRPRLSGSSLLRWCPPLTQRMQPGPAFAASVPASAIASPPPAPPPAPRIAPPSPALLPGQGSPADSAIAPAPGAIELDVPAVLPGESIAPALNDGRDSLGHQAHPQGGHRPQGKSHRALTL